MPLDQTLSRLYGRLSPAVRFAFAGCFLAGYLVHLYAFTNLIPNSDGLSRVYDLQQMTISGRWFLHYASSLNNFTQMPAVIGLLSVLFLSLSAALAVDMLGLRSRTLAALAGALMAAFPCVGYTFLYLFTASAYCLAIFLSVLSVWLARRKGRLCWLAAVAALALAMGIYQAYVTVAISLCLLIVLRRTLDLKSDFHTALRLGLRLAAYLAAGAVVYYLILLIFLRVKDLELLSYLGMDQASAGYPLGRLPGLILAAYKQVVAFFFLPGGANAFTSLFLAALDLIALALGLACFLSLMGQGLGKEIWRPVGALAMVSLLPLGMNFMQVLSPYSAPTPLMKYAFVAVYLAVLMLLDLSQELSVPLPRQGIRHGAALLWCSALLLFCLNTNNLLYTASAQAHRATESYATRLAARVEGCPGYRPGMEVAIIGSFPTDRIYADIPSYAQIDHYSVPIHTVAPLNKHIYYYLSDWLNLPLEEPEEAVMLAVAASPEFQAMPLYPADGSVQVLDGRVVVKVQEEYTPKSDYEIAYENRR